MRPVLALRTWIGQEPAKSPLPSTIALARGSMLSRYWTVQLGYGPISGRPPVVGMYLVSEPEPRMSVSVLSAHCAATAASVFSGMTIDLS